MDIKTMLKREEFYHVFKQTYELYINNHKGKMIDIIYSDNRLKGEYVCYERLNVITRRFPPKEHIRYALSEYNIRGSFIKYIVAKIWVLLSFASLGLVSGKTFNIKGMDKHNNYMIWPCNRSIRIFNFEQGTVTSVVKEGFPTVYFENSITFRTKNSYDFIPPLLEYGNYWFKELILPGKALARVCNERLYSESISKVLGSMKELAKDTTKWVNVLEYAKHLELDIDNKVRVVEKNKKIKTAQLVKELAKNSLAWVRKSSGEIPIALTHGDLQTGNIWVDDTSNKVYIIDWETNSYRSIWYDAATLLCSLRRKNGLINMVITRNELITKQNILINDKSLHYEMDMVVGIIILENMIFYLDDILALPQNYRGEGFDSVIQEMSRIDWNS